VEQQREATKWVLENGGKVGYDYEYDSDDQLVDSKPPVPKWLHDLLGVDYFFTVKHIALSDTQVSDVTTLASLTNLESLLLDNTQVSDVTPLATLKNLQWLVLSNTPVNNLEPLAGLTNLEGLFLDNTQVSDETPLAGLTNLECLWLDNTQISDEEIAKLKLALPSCDILH